MTRLVADICMYARPLVRYKFKSVERAQASLISSNWESVKYTGLEAFLNMPDCEAYIELEGYESYQLPSLPTSSGIPNPLCGGSNEALKFAGRISSEVAQRLSIVIC